MPSPDHLQHVKPGDPVLATQHNIMVDRIKAMARSGGPGTFVTGDGQIVTRPIIGDEAEDTFALARLTEADGTNAWQYVGEEVIGDDPAGDPPSWSHPLDGRTWGVNENDEGLITHPLQIEGLETTDSGSDAVYMLRRIDRGDGTYFWIIVGAAGGSSLPEPGSKYMVLQLQGDPDLVPVWDYPRVHA